MYMARIIHVGDSRGVGANPYSESLGLRGVGPNPLLRILELPRHGAESIPRHFRNPRGIGPNPFRSIHVFRFAPPDETYAPVVVSDGPKRAFRLIRGQDGSIDALSRQPYLSMAQLQSRWMECTSAMGIASDVVVEDVLELLAQQGEIFCSHGIAYLDPSYMTELLKPLVDHRLSRAQVLQQDVSRHCAHSVVALSGRCYFQSMHRAPACGTEEDSSSDCQHFCPCV